METKWYKIKRTDGSTQYATKHDGLYYLGGSGFGISKLGDCISVEEVDEKPTSFVEGFAFFDDDEGMFRAIEDKNSSWNGWSVPYIHHSEIDRLAEMINWDEGEDDAHIIYREGENVIIETRDGEVWKDVVEPTFFNGEPYYYMNSGWCFMFKAN